MQHEGPFLPGRRLDGHSGNGYNVTDLIGAFVMKLTKRKPTGREVDEAAIERLEELRKKLHADNASAARNAASNLSWLQEDGYEILEEGLLKGTSRLTRGAAAYGLRKMRGRMKKKAVELLEKGRKSRKKDVAEVCTFALELMAQRRSAEQQPEPGNQQDGQPRKKKKRRRKKKKKKRPVFLRGQNGGRSGNRSPARGFNRSLGRGRNR